MTPTQPIEVTQTPSGERVEVYALGSGARLYVPLVPRWRAMALAARRLCRRQALLSAGLETPLG